MLHDENIHLRGDSRLVILDFQRIESEYLDQYRGGRLRLCHVLKILGRKLQQFVLLSNVPARHHLLDDKAIIYRTRKDMVSFSSPVPYC